MKPISITIISNDDDTITLEGGGYKIHIEGDSWESANKIAHFISSALHSEDDLCKARVHLSELLSCISQLKSLASTTLNELDKLPNVIK